MSKITEKVRSEKKKDPREFDGNIRYLLIGRGNLGL